MINDTPIQSAIMVYSMAILRLIQFWKLLNEHLDQNSYCFMNYDTDSLYLGIASFMLDECVKIKK